MLMVPRFRATCPRARCLSSLKAIPAGCLCSPADAAGLPRLRARPGRRPGVAGAGRAAAAVRPAVRELLAAPLCGRVRGAPRHRDDLGGGARLPGALPGGWVSLVVLSRQFSFMRLHTALPPWMPRGPAEHGRPCRAWPARLSLSNPMMIMHRRAHSFFLACRVRGVPHRRLGHRQGGAGGVQGRPPEQVSRLCARRCAHHLAAHDACSQRLQPADRAT